MWGKPRRNQITATLCCERFLFYNQQQQTTHVPPPSNLSPARLPSPGQAFNGIGSGLGFLIARVMVYLPWRWRWLYLCDGDGDGDDDDNITWPAWVYKVWIFVDCESTASPEWHSVATPYRPFSIPGKGISLLCSLHTCVLCSVHKCVLLNMLYILCKGSKQSPTRWNHHHWEECNHGNFLILIFRRLREWKDDKLSWWIIWWQTRWHRRRGSSLWGSWPTTSTCSLRLRSSSSLWCSHHSNS